ncbi:MAG: MFS transporter [Dehalococcoidia bacterium]|nr:MFS transporter [Dehalococcoidia bacterium]
MIQRLRARVFYGWWMVASGMGIQLLISGLLNQSYGTYVVLLREDFGWSKTALSGAYSLQQVESGLLGPVQGWIIDKFGPRPVMRVGVTLLGVGFMLMSLVHSLPAFYGAFFIMALGASLSGFFPLTVAVVNWFRRFRSFAISTMSTGFAAGGLMVPIVAFSMEEFGWRSTAFASGILVLMVGLPLVQVIRRRPEDQGDVVDGIREPAPVEGAPVIRVAASGERDFTLKEAVRTPAFWFISLGHGSALLIVTAVQVHVVSHLKDGLGYSLGGAAQVYTLMTIAQITGMVVGGLIGDRYDKRLIAFACMGMHTAGLLLVAHATMTLMVMGFAVLHGFAWGCRGPLMQAIRADYFGRTNYGVIMGWSSMIVMIGTIAGPLVAGILADVTGSYQSGFTVLAILAGMGSGFFLLSKRPTLPDDTEPRVEPQAAGAL